MKDARVSMCQVNLQRVEEVSGWEHFRDLLVTGDETWVPFFDPPTKQESMVSGVIIFVFEIYSSCQMKCIMLFSGLDKERIESAAESEA